MKRTIDDREKIKIKPNLSHYLRSSYRGLCALLFFMPIAVQAEWPIATPDSIDAVSNQLISIPVLENDIGDSLKLVEVNTTTKEMGTASLNADKQSITYQSANDFEGTDTLWYAFTDPQGRTNAAKVTVTVISGITKPIEWPTADYDSTETTVNTSTEIDVLSNDSGVRLTLTEVNDITVKLGQAKINADGKTIQYTPPQDYTGPDEFWYAFSDSWGRTNAGKVTLLVKDSEPEPYTGWPITETDNAETVNTATVVIPVLDNDRGQNLSLVEVNNYTQNGGRAKIEGDNIRYAPPVDFSGKDVFWYALTDDRGRTNSAKVTVTVTTNTENSTIAFCEMNYSTDGTKEGTFTTQQIAEPSSYIGGVEILPFPDQQDGGFAMIGQRHYYLEEVTPTKILWMEENGVSKKVTTLPEEFTLYGVGEFNGTLFYVTTSNGTSHQLYSHDGEQKVSLGSFNGSVAMLDNLSAAHFVYSDDNVDRGRGDHFLRVSNVSGLAIEVALDELISRVDTNVFSIFNYNGLDYVSDYFRVASTIGSEGATQYTITQKNIDHGITLMKFPGRIVSATISQNRLLFKTTSHIAIDSVGSTSHPAKLYTVNVANDIIELAVCE